MNRKSFLLYICKQIRQNISILCYHLFRIQGFVSSSYEFKRFLSLPLQHYQHSLSEILCLYSFWQHKLRNVSKFGHNHKNHHLILWPKLKNEIFHRFNFREALKFNRVDCAPFFRYFRIIFISFLYKGFGIHVVSSSKYNQKCTLLKLNWIFNSAKIVHKTILSK